MKRPNISANTAGIKSPNPFWLGSGPPTNTGYQICRAFEAGWGGAVWKTLTHDPITNVSSRYGAMDYDGRKVVGFNNIELISDRPLVDNLREITQVKKEFPKHAVIASLMVESNREAWHDIVKRAEDAGADGLELNFGCPHGMSERGMGSAVGQVPEYAEMITGWVKEVAQTPVLVKLTPNITDVRVVGRAAKRGGADGLSLINTINSIMGVNLDTFNPVPHVNGRGSHGGYCGPAVKPIALNMVQSIALDPEICLPISGIGGIQAWQDAVEHMLLGASTAQVCTAAMHYGFRIVEHMISGLEHWMMEKGFTTLDDFIGASVQRVGNWNDLDLSYTVVARIDQEKCINCGLCYSACEDGAHQSIDIKSMSEPEYVAAHGSAVSNGSKKKFTTSGGVKTLPGLGDGRINVYTINEETCVGCNLCSFVCPVTGCITMVEQERPEIPKITWREYQQRLAAGTMDRIQSKPHAHREWVAKPQPHRP
ncbi:NAD-dependent dihydropyrimidine dehydrogenase subunit PreA [bacterium]|nr:NAD-dependent dihydropyrimidine dehydrogenase subunit PreA [bacterium]